MDKQRKKLSITSGKLNQLTDQQLENVFEKAHNANITEIDISGNKLTELSLDLIISVASVVRLKNWT